MSSSKLLCGLSVNYADKTLSPNEDQSPMTPLIMGQVYKITIVYSVNKPLCVCVSLSLNSHSKIPSQKELEENINLQIFFKFL